MILSRPQTFGLFAAAVVVVVLALGNFAIALAPLFADGPDHLVDSWEVEIVNEPVVPGKPIELSGVFVCTADAIEADPLVQFSSAISEEGLGGWTVARDLNPPLNIARACGDGTAVEFEYAWSDLVTAGVLEVADADDHAEVRISVASVDGEWEGATVISPGVAFDLP